MPRPTSPLEEALDVWEEEHLPEETVEEEVGNHLGGAFIDLRWPLRTGFEFSDSSSRALPEFLLGFCCLALWIVISVLRTQLMLAASEPSHSTFNKDTQVSGHNPSQSCEPVNAANRQNH